LAALLAFFESFGTAACASSAAFLRAFFDIAAPSEGLDEEGAAAAEAELEEVARIPAASGSAAAPGAARS
jgi:hypothetical protein